LESTFLPGTGFDPGGCCLAAHRFIPSPHWRRPRCPGFASLHQTESQLVSLLREYAGLQ